MVDADESGGRGRDTGYDYAMGVHERYNSGYDRVAYFSIKIVVDCANRMER